MACVCAALGVGALVRVKCPEAAMIVFFFEGVDEALEGVEEEGVFEADGVRGVRLPLDRALPR